MSDFSVETEKSNDKRWPPLFYVLALPIYLVYKVLVLSVRLQGLLVEKQCWLLGVEHDVVLRESQYWVWMKDVSVPLPKLKMDWWSRDE